MFKRNIVVGVSVHPEVGLEVAQIDFANKVVLKYGVRELGYDNARREIADMDIFKESLKDLLTELDIPKGSSIVLNMPTVNFNVTDYPASLGESEIETAIEEELLQIPFFQNNDPSISAVKLPNSTMQNSKIAYTATPKFQLIEIAMTIQELKYNLVAIDTSVNSTLNALIYNSRMNPAPDTSWVLLIIENTSCRIVPMQGRTYLDCFEEKISIGEVLGDAENYSTVLNAIAPILKNVPTQCLYIVSKTNIISAEVLASKIKYTGQVVHHDANSFAKSQFIDCAPTVDENYAKRISLDVIGAAINRNFMDISVAHFNLYNASLGDIYTSNQPLVIRFGSIQFVATLEKMVALTIVFGFILFAATLAGTMYFQKIIDDNKEKENAAQAAIEQINKFLEENNKISSDLFDEGYEIQVGLINNKRIYSYYTIVGTEIPKKVWLTSLELGKNVVIEGQADNLESVYGFLRNLRDYDPNSNIAFQKLGLASESPVKVIPDETLTGSSKKDSKEELDTDIILTSLDADYYEFTISDSGTSTSKSEPKSEPKDGSDLPDLN